MTETRGHKTAMIRAAGPSGRTEVPLKSGRILDAATKVRAIEVERGGTSADLQRAAQRLKESGKPQRVLIVPQTHMGKARQAMKDVGIAGTVKNLSGTKRVYVGARSGTPKYEPVRKTHKK